MRCQKSVFLVRADADHVNRLLDEMLPLLEPNQDCVQAWALTSGQPLEGMARGQVPPLEPDCVLSEPTSLRFVERSKR